METFTDDMVQRPQIRAFIPKVERFYIPSGKTYSGTTGHTEIEIATQQSAAKGQALPFAYRVSMSHS